MCAKSRSWKSLYFLAKGLSGSYAGSTGFKILPFGRDMLSGTMVFGGASRNSKPRFSVNRVARADSTIHPFECGFPPERESVRRLTSWFAAARAELTGLAVLPFECWGMGRSPMVTRCVCPLAGREVAGRGKCRRRVPDWQAPPFCHSSVGVWGLAPMFTHAPAHIIYIIWRIKTRKRWYKNFALKESKR